MGKRVEAAREMRWLRSWRAEEVSRLMAQGLRSGGAEGRGGLGTLEDCDYLIKELLKGQNFEE